MQLMGNTIPAEGKFANKKTLLLWMLRKGKGMPLINLFLTSHLKVILK